MMLRHTHSLLGLLAGLLLIAALASGCASAGCKDGESCDNSSQDTVDMTELTDSDSDVPADANPDGTVDGDATGDTENDSDAAQPDGDDAADDINTGVCNPNQDGVIERDEIPLRVGLRATFDVAIDVTFDTAGTVENGERVWDLSGDFPSDRLVLTELRDPSNLWFTEDFPNATYVTSLSEQTDLLGIFQITDDELLLLGLASPEDSITATNMAYDPPVAVLQFPLEEGNTWSTDSTVTGTFNGAPFTTVFEDYTYRVDASGILKTPFGEFPVLRIRSTLERTFNFIPTTTRSFVFITECFGTVGNISSTDNETEAEFTNVSELRRLAP